MQNRTDKTVTEKMGDKYNQLKNKLNRVKRVNKHISNSQT